MEKLINFGKLLFWWMLFIGGIALGFALSSCSITINAMQMQLEDGTMSGKHECKEVVKKQDVKNAERTDTTITVNVDGAKLIMYKKQ